MASCLRPPDDSELDQYCDDENLFYDDGVVWALCTLERGTLVVHDLRTLAHRCGEGHAKRALEAMNAEFGPVVANGVEDDSPAEAFWMHMGEVGLACGMRQYLKADIEFTPAPPALG